jgi:hypothetical protein
MIKLSTSHGDKLKSLLQNEKLPIEDRPRIKEAINRYENWLQQLKKVQGTPQEKITEMVNLLNDYRLYIDLELIFESNKDFLYRQKGQLKLDNTVIEEFIPILVTAVLSDNLKDYDLSFGPTTCFSSIRFESSLISSHTEVGMQIREKDQDFAISKKLFIRASHFPDFKEAITKETHIAYVAAECKTNLDKTMFQEAAATAIDVKIAVPTAKYYLLCEWLDMTPISTRTTAIDEVIVLRKAKRLSSNIRKEFDTFEGRQRKKAFFEGYLKSHPFTEETFSRFLTHICNLIGINNNEKEVLTRGYF